MPDKEKKTIPLVLPLPYIKTNFKEQTLIYLYILSGKIFNISEYTYRETNDD